MTVPSFIIVGYPWAAPKKSILNSPSLDLNYSRQFCKETITKLLLAYSFRKMLLIGKNLNHVKLKKKKKWNYIFICVRFWYSEAAAGLALKKTLAEMLSCEFCKIFKNNFFTEHVWETAFRYWRKTFFIA